MKLDFTLLTGRIGGDAKTRPVGKYTVTEFSLAAEKFKKPTAWHRVSIWGKRGVSLEQYLLKGTQVAVFGELDAKIFESKNGPVISSDVKCIEIELLSKAKTIQREVPENNQQQSQTEQPMFTGDDIPF